MKKGDAIVIAVALLVAIAALFLFANPFKKGAEHLVAIVEVDGEEVYKRDLKDTQAHFTAHYREGENEVVIGNGSAEIVAANCSDGLCVTRGKLVKAGQTAVCLPNHVVLRIEGAREDDIDIIVGY